MQKRDLRLACLECALGRVRMASRSLSGLSDVVRYINRDIKRRLDHGVFEHAFM